VVRCRPDAVAGVYLSREVCKEKQLNVKEESRDSRGTHVSSPPLLSGRQALVVGAPLRRQGMRITVDSLQGSAPDTRMNGVRATRCLNDEFKCPGMGQRENGFCLRN
jgi:hypothetical protein